MSDAPNIADLFDKKIIDLLSNDDIDFLSLDPRTLEMIRKRIADAKDGEAFKGSVQDDLLRRAKARSADLKLTDHDPNDGYERKTG